MLPVPRPLRGRPATELIYVRCIAISVELNSRQSKTRCGLLIHSYQIPTKTKGTRILILMNFHEKSVSVTPMTSFPAIQSRERLREVLAPKWFLTEVGRRTLVSVQARKIDIRRD